MVNPAGAPVSTPVLGAALTLPGDIVEASPVHGRIVFVLADAASLEAAQSLTHGLAALPGWRGTNAPSYLVRDLVAPSVRAHAESAGTGGGFAELVDGGALAVELRSLCDSVFDPALGSATTLVELVPEGLELATPIAAIYPDAARVAVTEGPAASDAAVTCSVTAWEIATEPRAALARAAGLSSVDNGAARAMVRNHRPRGEHRVLRDLLATPDAANGVPFAAVAAQPGSGAEWLLALLAVHPQVLLGPAGGSGMFAVLATAWRAALDPASALHELAGSAVLINAVRHYADQLLVGYAVGAGRPDAVVVDLVTDAEELATARGLRPDAAFVHLVRDGRAVAAGDWLAAGGHVGGYAAGAAWATGVLRSRAVLARLQNQCELRVEDAVSSPLPHLDELIERFDLSSDLATFDALGAAAAADPGPPPAPTVPGAVLAEVTAGAEAVLSELGYH